MRARQRVILVVLIIAGIFQQGFRLYSYKQNHHWESGTTSISYAAEMSKKEIDNRHCPLVHINTAGMAELQTLPGIGPTYAERIIIERNEQIFKDKQELLRVKGIGEKRLAKILDLICLYYEE